MKNRYQSSVIALASFVTLSACGVKTLNQDSLPGTSHMASITMPVPEKLKALIGPDKVSAYSLNITPGTCDPGVTGTKIEKTAQQLTLSGASLANEKLNKGCAYTLIVSLGKANAAGTALDKTYLTNDMTGKRTEITADQTRVDQIKALAILFITEDGKTALGMNDQGGIIIPSSAESDVDIEIAIGQSGGTGNNGLAPTPGDYDWKTEGPRCGCYIFGSRVGTSYHHHSDVDILYSMSAGKTVDAVAISKIREAIEESRFPFKVDLVDEKDLAESYRSNVSRTRHAI